MQSCTSARPFLFSGTASCQSVGKEQVNPNNTKQFDRLKNAVAYARRKMQPFREKRVAAIRQYVGAHYSDNGAQDKVPVDLLALAIKIYLRHLVARRPKVVITTEHQELKANAYLRELALNKLVEEINFGRTMELGGLDAMFSVALFKLGLEYGDEVEINGYMHDVGQVFCDIVDLDDAVWDMGARTWEKVAFVGNRYRLPVKYVRESGTYPGIGKVEAAERKGTNESGDERAETISRGADSQQDEYEEQVELQDIYLPRENLMVTYPIEGDGKHIEEWTGPERGPYRMLGYGDVPGQVMPLAPIALWMDLHTLANVLYRKLGRQAERQKTNLGYRGSAARDAERVKQGKDGEVIQMDDPDGVKEFKSGGIDQANLAMFIHCRDLFSWIAGNLDSMGGLGPQAETLGQDVMLAGSASKTLQDLQDRTVVLQTELIEAFGWYQHYDPLIDMQVAKRVEGTDVRVPAMFTPETREGDFWQFNFKVIPYSAQYLTPTLRLQMIERTWREDILPMLPLLEAQGIVPNVEAYLRLKARYTDIEELNDIVEFGGESMAQQAGPTSDTPRQSPVTRRENVRINRPGATRSGKDDVMTRMLMGRGVQDSEAAALTRGST